MPPALIELRLLDNKANENEACLMTVRYTGAKRKIIKFGSNFHASLWCLMVIIVIYTLGVLRKLKLDETEIRWLKMKFTML